MLEHDDAGERVERVKPDNRALEQARRAGKGGHTFAVNPATIQNVVGRLRATDVQDQPVLPMHLS